MRSLSVDPVTGCSKEQLSFEDVDPNLYVGYVMSQVPFEVQFSLDPLPERPSAVVRLRSRMTQTLVCTDIDKSGHVDFDVLNANLNIPFGRRVIAAYVVDFKVHLVVRDL